MRGPSTFFAAVSVLGLLSACSDESIPGAGAGTTTTSSTTGSGGAGGADECAAPVVEPGAAPTDWCERVTAGAAGIREVATDLSAAHAAVRFFSPIDDYIATDLALAAALEAGDALAAPDLTAYVAALDSAACAPAPDAARALGEASVEAIGSVALIHPGTGTVALPEATATVVVDLRGLPEGPDTAPAVEAAVATALAAAVPRPREKVRRHSGLVDEVFSAANVYTSGLVTVDDLAPIAATGAAELPLILLTEPVMPSAAAEIAATLRLAGRAWLWGEDLRMEVAESRWFGVGERGVAVRLRELVGADARWPDVVPADRRADRPQCLVRSQSDLPSGAPPALSLDQGSRRALAKVDSFDQVKPATLTVGAARAALVIAHGAVRRFYPFDVPELDARLTETLATVGDEATLDHLQLRNALRRFGEALSDGHNFVFDPVTPVVGYLAVMIEDVGGEPVVRRSNAPGVAAGDTIESIGGVPVADLYAVELARTSAASDGYRFNLATRYLLRLAGPTELGLRDATGATKTITVDPQPVSDVQALGFAPVLRGAGWLGDLGAPTVYYINLADEVLTDMSAFTAALTEAAGASGLVVDMRGYPGIDHYAVARRLIDAPFSGPQFHTPMWAGADALTTLDAQYDLTPLSSPSFGGPIALLVGHMTVSAAENFSTMLVDANRVTVVGRQSAATNGNITGVQLPGSLAFTFTGMVVRHADGAPYIGIGIVPDIDVTLGAQAFAAGDDPELDAAIAALPPP